MLDMNIVDSPSNIISQTEQDKAEIFDLEETEIINDKIRDQYQRFENLGSDFITKSDLTQKQLLFIYEEFLNYVNDTFLPVISYDDLEVSPKLTLNTGKYLYWFYIRDLPNSILPNLFINYNINSLEDFEKIILTKSKDNYHVLRIDFSIVISDIIKKLNHLRTLDTNIIKDKRYRELIYMYNFYLETVDTGVYESFVKNYLIPVVNKEFFNIMSKTV